MPSKTINGFDLILGPHYNDGWYNQHEPLDNGPKCLKCSKRPTTIHQLQKQIFAFGNVITKLCVIYTCSICLHEVLAVAPYTKDKVKATKQNLTKLFAKLPKSIQTAILSGGTK